MMFFIETEIETIRKLLTNYAGYKVMYYLKMPTPLADEYQAIIVLERPTTAAFTPLEPYMVIGIHNGIGKYSTLKMVGEINHAMNLAWYIMKQIARKKDMESCIPIRRVEATTDLALMLPDLTMFAPVIETDVVLAERKRVEAERLLKEIKEMAAKEHKTDVVITELKAIGEIILGKPVTIATATKLKEEVKKSMSPPTTHAKKPVTPTALKMRADGMYPEVWALADVVVPHCRRLLFTGPPGTGKTHMATLYATKNNDQQVLSITMTEDTPAAELRGHFIPKGHEFIWHDGPAIVAWRKGHRLVINEIDKACGDVFSFLLALMDNKDVAALTLPTGETVRPHEDFAVVATSNASIAALPEALRDRFDVCLIVDTPNENAIKSLSLDLQKAARSSSRKKGDERIGLRSWIAFDEMRKKLGDEIAGYAVFGERAKDIVNSLKIGGGV